MHDAVRNSQPRRRRTRVLRVLAVALTGIAVAAGTVPSATAGSTPSVPPTVWSDRGGTGSAAVPTLAWRTCSEDFGGSHGPRGTTYSCAWATVPLDYDAPRGATVRIALKRLHAADPKHRIGTLFVNPGGPGASGVDFASVAWAIYPKEVLDRFDVVGFDPRGVARSVPLICFTTWAQQDAMYARAPFPVTLAEYQQDDRLLTGYGQLCRSNGGALLSHMSTADVARDLELLRRAVGDAGLTYAGYSYGSQLGTTYANLFPSRVRAMVLDGVVDPVAWTTGTAATAALPFTSRLGSDLASYAARQEFERLCRAAGPQGCSLAALGDPATTTTALLAVLRQHPVDVDYGDEWVEQRTYADVIGQMVSTYYSPAGWGYLADDLALVAEAAGVGRLPAAARTGARAGVDQRQVRSRAAASLLGDEEITQFIEGFDGVVCTDSVGPRTRSAWWAAAQQRDVRTPGFGSLWAWTSAACATWPVAAADRFVGPWTARTAAPVLVVGTLFDPATPYAGAHKVATLLPGSRLLTLRGYGHTSVGSSRCVDAAVQRYLVSRVLPAAGATCLPDLQPFDELDEVPEAAQRTATPSKAAAVATAREVVTGSLPGAGD